MTSLNDTTQNALDAFITAVGEKDEFGTFLNTLKDVIKKERDTEATAPAVTATAVTADATTAVTATAVTADATTAVTADATTAVTADAATAAPDAAPDAASPPDAPTTPAASADAPELSKLLSSQSSSQPLQTAYINAKNECNNVDNLDEILSLHRDVSLQKDQDLTALKKTNLYKFYTLIKSMLFNSFPGCYINDTKDLETNRYMFNLLHNAADNDTVDSVLNQLDDDISKNICKKNASGDTESKRERSVDYNVQFETKIRLGDNTTTKKFVKINNGGSGDCLFLTLVKLLQRANLSKYDELTGNDEDKAQKIRNDIVDFVNHDKNKNIQYGQTGFTYDELLTIGGVNGGSAGILYKDSYNVEMKKRTVFGTDLEISGAAKLYKINIYVVSSDGIDFDTAYFSDSNNYDLKNLWYIFNINQGHYVSLWCLDSSGNCPPNSGANPDGT
jgi:hypothetical protein